MAKFSKADVVIGTMDDGYSIFEIIDATRCERGLGSIEDCFDRIMRFIKSSKSKDDIDLNWVEVEMSSDVENTRYSELVEGDLIVSIYDKEEQEDYGSRTMANYGDYEEEILAALNGEAEESEDPFDTEWDDHVYAAGM